MAVHHVQKWKKETFTDGKVASYYNSNFIAVEVNSSYEDGKITSKKFGITINPAFIYYDSSGKELHKIVGFQSTKDFLQQGKKALNKFQSLSYFKQQYRTGKRDAAFLFEYAYRLKQSKELTPDVIVSYLKTQSDKELAKEQNIKFIYEFAIHDFKPVIAFDSREYNFMLNNINLFTDYFKKEQVEVRLVWIAYEGAQEIIKNKDRQLFNKVLSVMERFSAYDVYKYEEMDGRNTWRLRNNDLILFLKLEYNRTVDNKEQYEEVLQGYLLKNFDNADALTRLSWNYYKNYDDKANLLRAVEWVQRAINLQEGYLSYDTYAHLLYKLGNVDNALIQANKAIKIATDAGINYSETQQLVDKIQNK